MRLIPKEISATDFSFSLLIIEKEYKTWKKKFKNDFSYAVSYDVESYR